jgi:signal transduction histidine kinase
MPFAYWTRAFDALLAVVAFAAFGAALRRRALPRVASALLAGYALGAAWLAAFGSFQGFNDRAVLDVAACLGIALLAAREYGARKERLLAQEKELETARTAEHIARMTRMIAHDVRRPFAAIAITLDALEQGKTLGPELMRSVRHGIAAAETMLADLLQSGGAPRLNPAPASLAAMVDRVLAQAFLDTARAGASVCIDLKHVHQLHADAGKLERVLGNLIGNALEATGAKGQLWIEAAERDGVVEVVVGNSGAPIPAATQARLFTPFFTAGKLGGTGLGLTVAREIVQAHGGTIRCESDAAGTRFIFTCPVAGGVFETERARFVAPAARSRMLPPKDGRKRLVVVDDDVFMREAWEALHGEAEVLTWEHPQAFQAACERHPELLGSIDYLVTDFYFEHQAETGVAFALALRDAGLAAPIFLSSNSAPDALDHAAFGGLVLEKRVMSLGELERFLH